MKELTPIPTPPALRWRELRIRFLPALVFVAGVVALAFTWTRFAAAPVLVGQVEAMQVNVSSTKPGLLTQLRVERFKTVQEKEPVVDVIITDPRILEASLAVIRAQVALLRVEMDPLQGLERNRMQFERLKLDELQHRLDLATARVKLQYADSEFNRVDQLYRLGGTNVVSQQTYEVALRDRDALRAQIGSESNLIAQLERSLLGYDTADAQKPAASNEDTMRAAIKVQEERLRETEAQLSPITLRAPMSGTVNMVYRRPGENIAAGEPLVSIVGSPMWIIGYVRQLSQFEPRPGMKLRVQSKTPGRPAGVGTILQVGPLIEPMPRTLLYPFNNQVVEMGTPVVVSLPVGLNLQPGEIVDLKHTSR